MTDLASIRRQLAAIGQEHVLAFYDGLAPAEQRSLLDQLASIDLGGLPRLVETYVRNSAPCALPEDLEPAAYYPADPASPLRPWDRDRYMRIGVGLVAAGKVAVFTVAGGQGSRLGFDGPKGCYPAGAVTRRPLLGCIADWIVAAQRRWSPDRPIPWYIMTSPINHAATVGFFEDNDFFSLSRADVVFFPQGVLPSFDMRTGKLLLEAPGRLAVNPDGHGGSLRALAASGAIADMRRRGVEHISYTNIDNPLVRAVDPVFLGLHADAPDSSGEMSSKMVPKAYPKEKVGVLCSAGGRTTVIEYSDLPDALAHETTPDGRLRFNAGSIAIHAISVAFVEKLNSTGRLSLPLHRAEKKIPHVDPTTGERIDPDSPNGVKLETFVFDALPLCERSLVLETVRREEFAPIKNAEGVDSPETCSRIQTERAAAWLEAAGVSIPRGPGGEPDCTLEISPLAAIWADDLAGGPLPDSIDRGAKVAM